MTKFNHTIFKYEAGNIRLYAEFMNIYQSIVQTPLVLDICQMSTYQVIKASEGFYFNQFDIVNQMRIYVRCWDFAKATKKLDTDEEVLKALPSTIAEFNPTYEKLKETYFKASLHANSTDEEFNALKKDLINLLTSENQQEVKEVNQKLKEDNEGLHQRMNQLENIIKRLTGQEGIKLPSTSSGSMDVEDQEPSAQGIGASPSLKRKKNPSIEEFTG